jgi:hypothetical protein
VRNPFPPLPEGERVADLRVHELVRDFPELLALFGSGGPALPRVGRLTVGTAFLFEGGGLEELLALTSWRTDSEA